MAAFGKSGAGMAKQDAMDSFRIGVVTRLDGGAWRKRRELREIDETDVRWVCAAVAGGREFAVADDLAAIGFRTFCPHGVRVSLRARDRSAPKERRRRFERDYPVFGCYVFVGEPEGLRLAKRSHPHIVAVLDEGRLCAPAAFIRAAADLWLAGAWDERMSPKAKFRVGDAVRVKSGAFAGLTALVARMPSQTRAVISLALFGGAVDATLDADSLALV